jgi:hypothetical protein
MREMACGEFGSQDQAAAVRFRSASGTPPFYPLPASSHQVYSPGFSRLRRRRRRRFPREKEGEVDAMVQRLTYRKRHSYATKSNQTRVVKTPGEIYLRTA